MDVATLREIFRNFRQWESLRETDSLETLCGPDGEEYNFLDIQFLYENLNMLPKRQHEAIELYLIQNMREKDAAVEMGLSPTNPVGIYATTGLTKLLDLFDRGMIPRFRIILNG